MVDPEIAAEQAYIDRAHERLESMRDAARSVASEVIAQGAGGTFAARVERDIRVELSGRRLAHLDIGDAPVAFGRLDLIEGDRYYIGRLAVFDEDGDPLVVDWRAPVAEPFYRAIPAEPLGVARRRHFVFRGRRLTRLEDELLDREATGDLVLMGEAALLAALEGPRTGRMGDIVATIQAEQDAVIRSAMPGALVVQGGPGTGKTAVALHRAAYLLFTYRARLERQGVLLVGPNTVFLRYIEQVLPSLGEQAATLATPGELYAGSTRPSGTESHATAALKGDSRMAEVVARAVETRQRPLRQPLTVRFGAHDLVVPPQVSRRIVLSARRRRGSHNERRPYVEQQLVRSLLTAWRASEETAVSSGRRRPISDRDVSEVTDRLTRDLRRNPATAGALERMWPVLSPEQMLHDLFGAPALLERAGKGVLEEAEIELLGRERSASVSDVAWTDADLALLDEASVLLGPVSAARRAGRGGRGRGRGNGNGPSEAESWMLERALDDQAPLCPNCNAPLTWAGGQQPWRCDQPACGRSWRSEEVLSPGEQDNFERVRAHVATWFAGKPEAPVEKGARPYGHILVDEAQAMSPMQWRSLARRSLGGSFTIVGDLGQASEANSPQSWEEVLAALPGRSEPRVAQLSVNYRTPVEVMDLAASVLAAAAPDLAPPHSVRSSGQPPRFTRAAPEERSTEVAAVARATAAEVGDGRVAVIAPEGLAEELAGHLDAPFSLGTGLGSAAARRLLEAPISVLTVDAARGLEFDGVVLVEPAAIVDEHAQGLRALYVALTRTTRLLHVVHAAPLPESLLAAQPTGSTS